jgi:hypothetical protein
MVINMDSTSLNMTQSKINSCVDTTDLPVNFESSVVKRKRNISAYLLAENDEDNDDDNTTGIYSLLIKKAIGDINKEQRKIKEELDWKIAKQNKKQIECHTANKIIYNRKELKNNISMEIYNEWAIKIFKEFPELSKQAGYREDLWK